MDPRVAAWGSFPLANFFFLKLICDRPFKGLPVRFLKTFISRESYTADNREY